MLDLLLILLTVAVGVPAVAALLWKSYGPGGVYHRERAAGHMSTSAAVPAFEENRAERHSDAVERLGNSPEHEDGNTFPEVVPSSLVARVAALPHEELVGMLAILKDADGEWRYAESRLAKFAGGRVEDRIAEIRALRGTLAPPPPGRTLTIRANGVEHRVSAR